MTENNQPELKPLSDEGLAYVKSTSATSHIQIQRLIATIDSLRAPEPLGDLEVVVDDCVSNIVAKPFSVAGNSIYENQKRKAKQILLTSLSTYIHQRAKALAQEIRDQEKRKDEEWEKKLKALESDLEIEKLNTPFYKNLVGDFEAALGPHPTISNGCWIKRIEELRTQLDEAKKDKERLGWLEKHLKDDDFDKLPPHLDDTNSLRQAIDSAMSKEGGK